MGVARDGLLRHQDAVAVHTFLELGMHIHSGKQQALRVREYRAQQHRTRALVHRDLGELQLAGQRIGAAVLELQGNFGGAIAPALDLLRRQLLPEAQQCRR